MTWKVLFNLCGMSLGAVLALNYALDYPKKVQSLALIAPQANMPSVLLKVQNGLFRFMPEATFEKVGIAKKDMIALTNSMLKLNFTAQLHTISCPTLIVCGTKDYVFDGAVSINGETLMKRDGATGHDLTELTLMEDSVVLVFLVDLQAPMTKEGPFSGRNRPTEKIVSRMWADVQKDID